MPTIIRDAVPITSRVRTPEGFLSVQGAFTRTGVIVYDASQLGITDKTGPIRVMRTPESVFHPETIASLRDAVVTIEHPNREVTAQNWKQVAVGNITGVPAPLDSERLGGGLILRDARAVEALESGKEELSVGYAVGLEAASSPNYDFITDGPMVVNHLALTDEGRAGPEIRVFDTSKEGEGMPEISEDTMKQLQTSIQDSVKAAVAEAMPKPEPGSATPATPAIDAEALSANIVKALSPAFDSMKNVAEAMAAEQQRQAQEAAVAKAQDAAEKLVADTLNTERARVAVLDQAKPLIPAERWEGIKDSPIKEILVAAVGDSVPDAANQPEEVLRGAMLILAKNGQQQRQQVADYRQSTGIVGDSVRQGGAYADYVKSLEDGYKQPMNGKVE